MRMVSCKELIFLRDWGCHRARSNLPNDRKERMSLFLFSGKFPSDPAKGCVGDPEVGGDMLQLGVM
jgi:hypothetical protein